MLEYHSFVYCFVRNSLIKEHGRKGVKTSQSSTVSSQLSYIFTLLLFTFLCILELLYNFLQGASFSIVTTIYEESCLPYLFSFSKM